MSGKERCLSERQIFEYQEAFKKFDTSTTGQVKTRLLGDILRQLSFNPTKNELQDLTIQVDPNATGVLKLPNLLDIMSKIVDDENHDGQIMDAFNCFDKNGSGTLTRSDMEHVLANLGERLYEDEIRGLLDDGDEGDGTIVYSKFFAMENA